LEAVSQFAIDVEEFENSYTEVFLFFNVTVCVEHSACFYLLCLVIFIVCSHYSFSPAGM